MGIDYDGGMIVGARGVDIDQSNIESMGEWADENGLVVMSTYYDADSDDCYYGFSIDDILISKIDDKWVKDLKDKAAKFEDLAKAPAMLIGTQNIW